MEARFTAKQVWDVRAARALLHAMQKTPLWKTGAACAILGAALLALCLALNMKALGWICFAVLALIGAFAAFGLEPLAARIVFAQQRRRENEMELSFGEEEVRACNALGRSAMRYTRFRRFALCRGAYLLFYRQQQALVIAPENFSGGDAAAFEAFIGEKTGLALERVA